MDQNENLTINAIRTLSIDAIQKANSGHPGITLGAAPMAYALWANHLKHNPENPDWKNRDRFVLSAGHGSMLLYSLLHLFGYGNLSIDDLKQFRQLGSLTPGHPEYNHTVGVEVSTGPLGQGFANAVGMAFAEKHLASVFNRPNYDIVDHYTYALCGDGCMMEGISSEAGSLASTLGLGKLIVFYDSNNISIEGSTDLAFTEKVGDRFRAFDWHVQKVEDGNNLEAINRAIENAKMVTDRPSLIEVKTIIGYGSPGKAGKQSSHGEPLGFEEIAKTKSNLGWNYEEDFHVPSEVYEHISEIKANLKAKENEWNKLVEKYSADYPDLYQEYLNWYKNDFVSPLIDDAEFWNHTEDTATRLSSEIILNKISAVTPNLFGGSADLSPSNKSIMKEKEYYSSAAPQGSNIHFGVRELAMTAIANGIYIHGGLQPYIAGFAVFSDYMKPAMRLSAIMNLPVVSILTHDSIGVGEDGPTHQPIEQLASLRSIPNYTVYRPCDTNETAAAWYYALTNKTSPTGIFLTRQTVKALPETGRNALKGGYILKDSNKETPDIILISSGSEVSLIYDAYDVLLSRGICARVVSMPSFEVFENQSDGYKESVLPKNVVKRLAVEAGSSFGWYKYIGLDGDIISMESFGESGKFPQLFEKYGFTVDNVVARAEALLSDSK